MTSTFKQSFLLLLLVLLFSVKTGSAQKKDTARVLEPDQEFYKQGCKLADSAKYKEAIKVFQKAIKANPMMNVAFNKMAYCKVQLGDLKGATKDLEKSVKIQPDDQGALKYLGFVYLQDKKYQEAKNYLDSAKKIKKEDAELEFFIGNLQEVGKDIKGAIESYNNAIFLKENYGAAYLKRGLIYFKQDNFKLAIKDLNKGLELSPGDSSNLEVYRARADANYQMRDYKGAIRDYSRIITVDPKNEEAFIYRGAAKIETNDNSGAVDDESKAIDINKNSKVAYNFRGVAKGGLKAYGEAIKDLDMAIKLDVKYASAYVNRASIKYAMGEKKKACQDLEKAEQCGSNIAYKYIDAYCRDIQK